MAPVSILAGPGLCEWQLAELPQSPLASSRLAADSEPTRIPTEHLLVHLLANDNLYLTAFVTEGGPAAKSITITEANRLWQSIISVSLKTYPRTWRPSGVLDVCVPHLT